MDSAFTFSLPRSTQMTSLMSNQNQDGRTRNSTPRKRQTQDRGGALSFGIESTSLSAPQLSPTAAHGRFAAPKRSNDLARRAADGDDHDWLREDDEDRNRGSKRRRLLPDVSGATSIAGTLLATAVGAAMVRRHRLTTTDRRSSRPPSVSQPGSSGAATMARRTINPTHHHRTRCVTAIVTPLTGQALPAASQAQAPSQGRKPRDVRHIHVHRRRPRTAAPHNTPVTPRLQPVPLIDDEPTFPIEDDAHPLADRQRPGGALVAYSRRRILVYASSSIPKPSPQPSPRASPVMAVMAIRLLGRGLVDKL